MIHFHDVYDEDKYLIIDPKTRLITNHSDPIKKIIQGDHNCERVTFKLPRFIDGHDMSLCNLVRVQFVNIGEDGQKIAGYESITDLQVYDEDDQYIICSWLISGKATKLVGPLNFGIQFACVTGGVITYSWSTAICTHVTVSPGLDNGDLDEIYYGKTINDVPFTVNDKNKLTSLESEINKIWDAINSFHPTGGVD